MKMINRIKRLIRPVYGRSPAPVVSAAPDPHQSVWRDITGEEMQLIKFAEPFTMTSVERLVTLSRAVDYLLENKIDGDIVECGVWRGGSMMLVAKKLALAKETKKRLFLFDTFEGMNSPGEEDVAWDEVSAREKLDNANKFEGRNVWCFSTLEEVRKNIESCQYPQQNIVFVEGPVERTLPYEGIEQISLLRLDTDWYESTKHELEHLFDKLVVGGILIVDDYGHWQGARKAVDEFIRERKLRLFLNRIDYTGRLAVKIH